MATDAEQFAKVVLWHLAGARAELAAIEVRLAVLETRLAAGVPSETVQQEWKRRTEKSQADLYLEACRQAGLQTDKPPFFPPRAGGNIDP